MSLARRLGRLEVLVGPTTPRVWIEDLDNGMLVCQATGEQMAVEEARRLGRGDIVVRHVDDRRGHEPE